MSSVQSLVKLLLGGGLVIFIFWMFVGSEPIILGRSGSTPEASSGIESNQYLLPPLPDDPKAMAAAMFSYIEASQWWCRRLAMLGGAVQNGAIDGHKFICMDEDLAPRAGSCLVYSLGGNDEWSFEKDIIKQLKCEVHTFDPSLAPNRPRDTHGATLHTIGLAGRDSVNKRGWKLRTLSSLKQLLGHKNRSIDYLKVDVEGSEWEWLQNDISSLKQVKQLGMEIHIGGFQEANLRRVYSLLLRLQEAGFRTIFSEPNRVWGRRLHVAGVDAPVGGLYEIVWVRAPPA